MTRKRLFDGAGEWYNEDGKAFDFEVGKALTPIIQAGHEAGLSFRDMHFVIDAWIMSNISMRAINEAIKDRRYKEAELAKSIDDSTIDENSGTEFVLPDISEVNDER